MASSKRRPSKSKRYRQNKAVRDARSARSARAGEATAISRGERDEGAAVTETTSARTGRTKAGAGTKTAAAAPQRGRRKSPYTIPGQRAVVLAFLFTLVSAVTLLVAPIQVARDVPLDDPRVEEEDLEDEDNLNDDGTVTILDDGKLLEEETAPVAALVLVAPVAITGAALWFTKRPQRSTVWSMALVAMAGYVFFVGAYAVISVPSLIALAVAGFQSRRADNKVRIAALKAERAARKAAKDGTASDGTIIEGTATEDTGTVDTNDAGTDD